MIDVATGRTIFTYGTGIVPQVVLAGIDNGADEFFIEQILSLPEATPHVLLRAMREGIRQAKARGYRSLQTVLLDAHPRAAGISALLRRLGFEPFDIDDRGVYYRLEI